MTPLLRPAVLLVDDDATLLSALARRLTREGFDVRTAPSGERRAGRARARLAGAPRHRPHDAGHGRLRARAAREAHRRPADHRPQLGRRVGVEGARARGVRRGLHHEAIRPRRAGRARPARHAANRGRAPRGDARRRRGRHRPVEAAARHRRRHARPDPGRDAAAPAPHRLARSRRPDRDDPRAGLVGGRWRRPFLRVGHRAAAATQARDRPGPAAVPAHRARRRLSAGIDAGASRSR